jgi:hypothetical protein
LDRRSGRVVELFAGVGGFRLGLERSFGGFSPEGGFRWDVDPDRAWDVVWANQWEPSTRAQPAADNYVANLLDERPDALASGEHRVVNEDIAKVLDAELGIDGGEPLDPGAYGFPEEFELLVGGFPCQDYSVAKPLSQADGIEGKKGVLWWEIHRILEARRPPHVLLENVDRLLKSPSTQRGRDFAVMLACFARLGYRAIGQYVEGQRQQAVAGEDGGRFVEGPVHGRLAAAKIVVVHGRQIVMDQRIAMHAFQRRGDPQRCIAGRFGFEQRGTFQHQKRPQALAAIEHAVPHRRHQARRPHDLAAAGAIVEQPPQQRLDRFCACLKNSLERQIG